MNNLFGFIGLIVVVLTTTPLAIIFAMNASLAVLFYAIFAIIWWILLAADVAYLFAEGDFMDRPWWHTLILWVLVLTTCFTLNSQWHKFNQRQYEDTLIRQAQIEFYGLRDVLGEE